MLQEQSVFTLWHISQIFLPELALHITNKLKKLKTKPERQISSSLSPVSEDNHGNKTATNAWQSHKLKPEDGQPNPAIYNIALLHYPCQWEANCSLGGFSRKRTDVHYQQHHITEISKCISQIFIYPHTRKPAHLPSQNSCSSPLNWLNSQTASSLWICSCCEASLGTQITPLTKAHQCLYLKKIK